MLVHRIRLVLRTAPLPVLERVLELELELELELGPEGQVEVVLVRWQLEWGARLGLVRPRRLSR